jgi:hypothetical protein
MGLVSFYRREERGERREEREERRVTEEPHMYLLCKPAY